MDRLQRKPSSENATEVVVQRRVSTPAPSTAGEDRAPSTGGGSASVGSWDADAGLMSALGLGAVQKKEDADASSGSAAGSAAAAPAGGDADARDAGAAAAGGAAAGSAGPESAVAPAGGAAPEGAEGTAAGEEAGGAVAASAAGPSGKKKTKKEEEDEEAEQQDQEAQAAPAEDDVQGKDLDAGGDVRAAAGLGISGTGGSLPFIDQIQASFGHHDVSGVQAHTDDAASRGSAAMGAEAYATGNHVAFGGAPSLHTAAHEAAHVVQQRAGISLYGGVGVAGDVHEQHADAVADRVVAGQSAVDLLDSVAPQGGAPASTDGVQMVPTEFIPAIAVTPQTKPELKLYGKHTQRFSMTNHRSAPRGTSFLWGNGASPPVIAYDGNTQSSNNGATIAIPIQADKPGAGSVQGTPVHQVPGGPEVTGATNWVRINVPRPTAELLSTQRRDASGTAISAPTDRCGVGETIRHRVFIGNVDGQHWPSDGADIVILSGANGNISVGDITPAQTLPNGKSFDIDLKGESIGFANGQLELGLPGQVLGNGPKVQFNIHVEMDRARFMQLTNNVNTHIDLANRTTTAWISSLAIAYGQAWKKHTDVLKAQDASNRLLGDLILGAALAFIPGGLGGVIGGAMKTAKSSDFMIDAVKDLAKWGLRRGGAELGAGANPPMQAFPDDPLSWQNQTTIRITTELAVATQRLVDWQTKATNNDPNFFCDFDPVEAMRSALTVRGVPASTLVPVDVGVEAINFEKGFWAKWLEMYAYTVQTSHGKAGPRSRSSENTGKKIKERCEQIGLPHDHYAAISERNADAEAARRNRSVWGG